MNGSNRATEVFCNESPSFLSPYETNSSTQSPRNFAAGRQNYPLKTQGAWKIYKLYGRSVLSGHGQSTGCFELRLTGIHTAASQISTAFAIEDTIFFTDSLLKNALTRERTE